MSAFGRLPFVVALAIAAAVVVVGEAAAFALGAPLLSIAAVGAGLVVMGFYVAEYSRRPAAPTIAEPEEAFEDPVEEAARLEAAGALPIEPPPSSPVPEDATEAADGAHEPAAPPG